MAPHSNSICKQNQFGYCKFKDLCKRKHVIEICEIDSCDQSECEKRHPKICIYFKRYKMCKFGKFCKYKHATFESDFEKNLKKEFCDLKNRMEALERTVIEKNDKIEKLSSELLNLKENLEKNKANIDTIEEEQMENSIDILDATFVNPFLENNGGQSDFAAKNKHGLKIHKSAKHTNKNKNDIEIEEVTLNIFGLATEPNLSKNTKKYKNYLESETEAVFSVDKIWMTYTSQQYKEGYLGKYLPMEIVLRTSVASLWNLDMDFRKDILENINKRLDVGKIVENIPEEQ